jgi:hypothetical protein
MTLAEESIPDGDLLSRFLIFPNSYEKESNEIAFEGFVTFERDHQYGDSLVWRKYAPEDQDVHCHGLNAAEKKRERRMARNEADPDVRYTGFLSARAGEIRTIESAGIRLGVKHLPEEGRHHAGVYCIPYTSSKIKTSVRSDLKLKLYKLMASALVSYEGI